MIVCDCCRKPLGPIDRTSFQLSWNELTEDMGAGNHIRHKEENFDICEDCRKSLLTCMDKGPIWEYVTRMDTEFTQIKCENTTLKAAIDEIAKKYKELKEEKDGKGQNDETK